jgi:hypothetical protein
VKLAPGTYWLTRDRDPITGEPDDAVDVWTGAPQRDEEIIESLFRGRKHIHTVTWFFTVADPTGEYLGRFPVANVRKVLGTVPDTDRECIRVERG